MFRFFKQKIECLIDSRLEPFRDEAFRSVDQLKFAVGEARCRLGSQTAVESLAEAEFKVFSQWGEDGIIQYLTHIVPIVNRTFVEIGVENYWESNTRFLLMKDNWAGLVIDPSDGLARFLHETHLRWRFRIDPVQAFVTRENVNELVGAHGLSGDIGLLSIDIDGVDYWVLNAISVVRPRILIVEYNSRFGSDMAVTVPYKPEFDRTREHFSNCYFGASLPAFCLYAKERDYAFVGTTSAGNNAFFVRNDVLPCDLRALSAKDGFTRSNCRESRDAAGRLTYLSDREELELMNALPLVDLTSGARIRVRDINS